MRLRVLAFVLLAGCAADEPERASVTPPEGGGHALCPPAASRPVAVDLRAVATNETGGRSAGVHRLDERRFLYVWGSFDMTLREDRVTRINPVQLALDDAGVTHVCASIDVAAPTDVDAEARSFGVGVLIEARGALPDGPVRVVVNWVAGCPCDPLPRGNATALFE